MRDVAVGHQRVIHLQHRDGALRRQLCRPFFFDAERGTAAGDRIPEKIVGVEPFPHQSQKERPGRGTTGVGDDSPDNIPRQTPPVAAASSAAWKVGTAMGVISVC